MNKSVIVKKSPGSTVEGRMVFVVKYKKKKGTKQLEAF